jgi:two-component system response regulator TrcR
MPILLLAEDEDVLGLLIKEALELIPGFKVEWVKDGNTAVNAFSLYKPDICILDVMMPFKDGFTVAADIRKTDPDTPILFLTARSQSADVVKGFKAGGNDYIKKPFSIEELVVRIQELLKRSYRTGKSEEGLMVFNMGKYRFFPTTQVLLCGDVKYNLTARESELLKELVIHRNSILDRKKILLQLWRDDNSFNARSMDVFIAKLRKYLKHDTSLSIINVRGYGYKFIEEAEN